jgi:hypothetical protein
VQEYTTQLRSIYNEKYAKYASESRPCIPGQQLIDDLTLTLTRFNGRKRNRQSQLMLDGSGGQDEISRYLAERKFILIFTMIKVLIAFSTKCVNTTT